MKHMTLKVEGMECMGCEKRICNALLMIEGIQEALASYEKNTVYITFSDTVNLEVIKNTIQDLGFSVLD